MKDNSRTSFGRRVALLSLLGGAVLTASLTGKAQTTTNVSSSSRAQTTYNTIKVDGMEIFYREAGDRNAPAVLLLHGFPTSSHMFRNLIPALADKYHVVAPDYPGFGSSSAPKA